jgi:acyl-CoA reductase LuxC
MADLTVPAVVRGEVVTEEPAAYPGRAGTVFHSPGTRALRGRLPLPDPTSLRELQDMPFTEIVDFLDALGERLHPAVNPHMREALATAAQWSDTPQELLASCYAELPSLFRADAVREIAEMALGQRFLAGWAETVLRDGRTAAVRAFGARAVHVIAGNTPTVAAMTFIRNAIARSDAVLKTPSNDPMTAVVIARTMSDMAPTHPITRHVSVAYWKGGDTTFEEFLYRPEHFEKLVAWGGPASVRHIMRYITSGLELVTLDPKQSLSIVGPGVLASQEDRAEAARRLALDVGAYNQELCVSARVAFVVTDDQAEAEDFAARVLAELEALPESLSSPNLGPGPELRAQLDAARFMPDWYHVLGKGQGHPAVVVSRNGEPVDFSAQLAGRTVNIVPLPDTSTALRWVDATTQTVGVYPDALKTELRDVLPLYGAQRLVSLGSAPFMHQALPQDAIEPIRRLVKWIVDETRTSEPLDVRHHGG